MASLIERDVARAVVLDENDRVLLLQVGELGNPSSARPGSCLAAASRPAKLTRTR